MPFTVTVHHGPFLLVVATGDGTIFDVLGMIDLAAKVVQMQNYTRVLFDSTSVDVRMSADEAALAGQHLAGALRGLEKVASVVRARSAGKAGEQAALAAGLHIKTFTDLSAATEWLGK